MSPPEPYRVPEPHGVPEPPHVRDHHCPTCADEGVPMTVSEPRGDGLAICAGEDGEAHEVLTALVDPVAPGDLLLVHAGTALIRLVQGGDE